jgi:membrane-associated phospholipid phosphatase
MLRAGEMALLDRRAHSAILKAMSTLRLPTPPQLERLIPVVFLATWIVCGIAVFAAAPRGDRLPHDDDAFAPAVYQAAAAVAAGFFAGGLMVGLLTVAHACAWRLVGKGGLSRFLGTVPIFGQRRVAPARKWDCPPWLTGQSPFRLSERRLRLLYLGFLLAAAAALPLDCGLAQWCLAGNVPHLLRDPLKLCAVFGHGLMAAVVLLAMYQLDPSRRRALWWVLACVALSGLAANGAKLLVARTRPGGFDFQHGVWATFGHWLPATSVAQSFPSGHTATAAGLALALAALYPRGRWLFLLLVVLVGCQRIECGAHFLSDVLAGAAASCLVVACCLRLRSWIFRAWAGAEPPAGGRPA